MCWPALYECDIFAKKMALCSKVLIQAFMHILSLEQHTGNFQPYYDQYFASITQLFYIKSIVMD